jgi:hypothetical protein
MSERLQPRRVAALNDGDLEEDLRLINKNSLNAFARAIGRILRMRNVRNICCRDRRKAIFLLVNIPK